MCQVVHVRCLDEVDEYLCAGHNLLLSMHKCEWAAIKAPAHVIIRGCGLDMCRCDMYRTHFVVCLFFDHAPMYFWCVLPDMRSDFSSDIFSVSDLC